MAERARLYQNEGKSGFVEQAATGIRNAGILAGILGTIAIIAGARVGWPIFIAGVGVAAVGEIGRGLAGSGKK